MKRIIHIILFAFLTFPMLGQITITDSYFPQPGDTLRVAVAEIPNVDLLTAGENLAWDFSNLQGPVFESVVLDASEGTSASSFPTATSLTGQLGITERYFKSTATAYESLGFSGADPAGLGLDISFQNMPAVIERAAPLNYNDDSDQENSVRVPFAWADLPAIITDSLGNLPITPDSIALEFTSDRTEDVDAWGTVTLPNGLDYEVLRVKRTEISETLLTAYVPFLGWTDVSGFIPNDFLGMDTTLTYRFYANGIKEEIAVVTVDPVDETVLNVSFKSDVSTTNVIQLHTGQPNVHAYPNPAINDVRFDIVNITPGKYTLKLYNILGVQVFDKTYSLGSQQDTIRINLYDFKKGTYLYSLSDKDGKPLATRRLMIIRP